MINHIVPNIVAQGFLKYDLRSISNRHAKCLLNILIPGLHPRSRNGVWKYGILPSISGDSYVCKDWEALTNGNNDNDEH